MLEEVLEQLSYDLEILLAWASQYPGVRFMLGYTSFMLAPNVVRVLLMTLHTADEVVMAYLGVALLVLAYAAWDNERKRLRQLA